MTVRRFPIAEQRARNARLLAQAEQLAADARASDDAVALPVIVVPANTRETEPLPLEARATFLTRLSGTIERVYRDGAPAAPAAPAETSASDTRQPGTGTRLRDTTALAAILGRSCATCRGECCTAGGTHAFLREDSVSRVRAQEPSLDATALLQRYEAYLPERHYRGSCVYHTTSGCALPRDLRANLCNRYVCGGLTQLTTALDASGGDTAYVAAADSVHLRRMARIDPQTTVPVTLRRAAVSS